MKDQSISRLSNNPLRPEILKGKFLLQGVATKLTDS